MTSKDETDEGLSPIQQVETVIKEKFFNKIFVYIFVSFLIVNWQEIIVLIKSKNDIYYTLAILYTGKPFLFGVIPAWLSHFGLPFIFGATASLITPYLTYFISKFTSLPLARMRHIDREADVRVKNELQNLRIKLSASTMAANNMENRVKDLTLIQSRLNSQVNELKNHRYELFKGIESFVKCHDKKGKIETQNDLIEFILAVENSDFYKDQALINKVNKMVTDIKNIYHEKDITSE